MADNNDLRNRPDGGQMYRMFLDGTLDHTNDIHRAWLEEYYGQLQRNDDMQVFVKKYAVFLRTYHPYMMSLSYGTKQDAI